ncbi:hypothetical protein J7L67_00810, partial [bacterium]|nr:hypothetical protein [bacterium]
DITCEIILKDLYEQVRKKIKLNNEYEKIIILGIDELEKFLFNEQDYLVPTSAGLIDYAIKKFL